MTGVRQSDLPKAGKGGGGGGIPWIGDFEKSEIRNFISMTTFVSHPSLSRRLAPVSMAQVPLV